MKTLLFPLILLVSLYISAQETPFDEQIATFQTELNEQFASADESPLLEEDRAEFKALDFYPVDKDFIVEAKFVRTPDEKPFEMKTSTTRKPIYVKYGEAHFRLGGRDHVLSIFQDVAAAADEDYDNYLFLPFKDKTCGKGSYGGGRFLDLKIPEGNSIEIDFNQAYNPYCAYSHRYSCPIPPKENHLKTKIKAGVMAFH